MVELVKHSAERDEEIIPRIMNFFGFHAGLFEAGHDMPSQQNAGVEETLAEWQSSGSELYAILDSGVSVGFLRIGYRGDTVAWIEDIYVDASHRGQGIATEAIRLAEAIVGSKPGYTALCLDVAPRNTAALKLYYKLGYTNLSLITVRKEFGENRRDRTITFLGKTFNV